jgi:hypothetical protein
MEANGLCRHCRSFFLPCGDSYEDCVFGTCSFTQKKKYVVSIGDSVYERMALAQVSKIFGNTIGKSIKLIENVDVETLGSMLALIRKSLKSILEARDAQDIVIEQKMMMTED